MIYLDAINPTLNSSFEEIHFLSSLSKRLFVGLAQEQESYTQKLVLAAANPLLCVSPHPLSISTVLSVKGKKGCMCFKLSTPFRNYPCNNKMLHIL